MRLARSDSYLDATAAAKVLRALPHGDTEPLLLEIMERAEIRLFGRTSRPGCVAARKIGL